MDGEIAVLAEGARAAPHGLLGHRASAAVIPLEGAPHTEIARGTHVAAAEASRQVPLGRPASESTDSRDALGHASIVRIAHAVEIELAGNDRSGDAANVFGLARRELP